MPTVNIFEGLLKMNRNANCTKIAEEDEVDGNDDDDGTDDDFSKATKMFHGYLSRCGLTNVLVAGLTELYKKQKETMEPILFLKTYLEVSLGVGGEIDKLKAEGERLKEKVDGVLSEIEREIVATDEYLKHAFEASREDNNSKGDLENGEEDEKDSENEENKEAGEEALEANANATTNSENDEGTDDPNTRILCTAYTQRDGGGASTDSSHSQRLDNVQKRKEKLFEAATRVEETQSMLQDFEDRMRQFETEQKQNLSNVDFSKVVKIAKPEESEVAANVNAEKEEEAEKDGNHEQTGARPKTDPPASPQDQKQKVVVKEIHTKVGSKDNEKHKAGGGTTKVYDKKIDYSNVKSKAGANDNIDHKAAGGTTKVFDQKTEYSKVQSKAGANDNIDHKAAGGTTKVFDQKTNYSKVQSKAGANDNIDHKAAGGTTKVFDQKTDYSKVQSKAGANDNIEHKAEGGTTQVYDHKEDYTDVKSKAGANDNIEHKPAGGDKKVFDQKTVYK